jgi:hypothetical protein
MSKGRDFYNRQLQYLQNGDIEGLVRDQYHDDAEMVTFEFTLKGKDAIRKYLQEDEPTQAGKVHKSETAFFAESDDCILFTAIIESEKLGTFIARDAFYLRDGKTYRHIALTLPPDKDPRPVPAGTS